MTYKKEKIWLSAGLKRTEDANKLKEGIEEKGEKRARRCVAQQRPELGVN